MWQLLSHSGTVASTIPPDEAVNESLAAYNFEDILVSGVVSLFMTVQSHD